jgi:regulator of cell morphogenesis and NO signaling
MWKEEMVLFPLVLGLEEARMSGRPAPPAHCGSIRNPIRVMEQEHSNATEALADLRRLSDGYTPSGDAGDNFRALYTGLAELDADLHRHIDLENDHLFPRAVQLEASLA